MSWTIGGQTLDSRLLMGSALFASPELMCDSIRASQSQIVTVSLRRQSAGDNQGQAFWDLIKALDVHILPNTAGCRTAKEAITTAQMAREVFGTNWVKLEVIGDDYTLQPDPFGLVEAARVLNEDGFEVFPYCTEDMVLANRLVDAGCQILMPWGAPIGSGQGLVNPYGLHTLRMRFPDLKLIVDAGIGRPSDAVKAMEMGFDGVLLNSAVAHSHQPVEMAKAFAHAVDAGRLGYQAGAMPKREMAQASTPVLGTPFWSQT